MSDNKCDKCHRRINDPDACLCIDPSEDESLRQALVEIERLRDRARDVDAIRQSERADLSTLKQRNSELTATLEQARGALKREQEAEVFEDGLEADAKDMSKAETYMAGRDWVLDKWAASLASPPSPSSPKDQAREAVIEAAREAEHSAGCELMREHSLRALWHCTCDLGKALAALDALEAGKGS